MDRDAREEPALKASLDDQALLLQLQEKDTLLSQLRHRRDSLPEHGRIAELAGRRTELDGARVELQTVVGDLTREQKKADLEVEQVRARKVRDEDRLNSGAIHDPSALAALQHELVALERRISTLEDAELDVMEQLEIAQAGLSEAAAQVAAVDADIAAATATRDAALAEIGSEAAAVTTQRAVLVGGVPEPLLALYDKVRGQYGGLGAAALVARRCEGCRLQLNDADLRELATAADDEVTRCPECSRILVRGTGSGL